MKQFIIRAGSQVQCLNTGKIFNVVSDDKNNLLIAETHVILVVDGEFTAEANNYTSVGVFKAKVNKPPVCPIVNVAS